LLQEALPEFFSLLQEALQEFFSLLQELFSLLQEFFSSSLQLSNAPSATSLVAIQISSLLFWLLPV